MRQELADDEALDEQFWKPVVGVVVSEVIFRTNRHLCDLWRASTEKMYSSRRIAAPFRESKDKVAALVRELSSQSVSNVQAALMVRWYSVALIFYCTAWD